MADEQIYQALRELKTDMKDGFKQLTEAFDRHEQEDRAVADRVLKIETQREDEKAAALRRGTWSGIVAGAGISTALKLIDKFWK